MATKPKEEHTYYYDMGPNFEKNGYPRRYLFGEEYCSSAIATRDAEKVFYQSQDGALCWKKKPGMYWAWSKEPVPLTDEEKRAAIADVMRAEAWKVNYSEEELDNLFHARG
jgi:hypothetical protein